MKKITQLFISATALIHLLFFKMESIQFMQPKTLERFGLDSTSGAFVQPWAFNQGFYNLFLAMGLVVVLHFLKKDQLVQAQTLGSFILATITGAGCVLFISAPHLLGAALFQGLPALMGLVTLNLFVRRTKRVTPNRNH